MQLNKTINLLTLGIGLTMMLVLAGCSHLPNNTEPNLRKAKIVESIDLADMTSNAIALAEQDSDAKVLVIFDVDNTLLTMPQDLGGDGWFGWQSTLLETEPTSTSLAVRDFSELIYLQGAFFSINEMTLTQPDAPDLLSSLHESNIQTIAVTARGHEFRGSTLRELKNNDLMFPLHPTCGKPLCSKSGLINSQIISDSVSALRGTTDQNKYRTVSISDGLVMLAGQDKGLFLELILESLAGEKFTHILVADDSKKNIENYYKAAPNIDAELVLYHYTKIEDETPPIESSVARRQKLTTDTKRIKQAICLAVQSPWCEANSSPR